MSPVQEAPLFDLDDFEETRVEWVPVWHSTIEDEGWHWDRSPGGWAIPLHADGTPITEAEWKAHHRSLRCRDCGWLLTKLPTTMGCGGVCSDGMFELCDGCARVDGLRLHEHRAYRCEPRPARMSHWTAAAECDDCTWELWTERLIDARTSADREPVPAEEVESQIAAHNRPYWAGRWGGGRLTRDEADRLIAEQARRRAKYLREAVTA